MEILRDNKVFKNDEREHNFEVENVWRVDDVNQNHTESVINFN